MFNKCPQLAQKYIDETSSELHTYVVCASYEPIYVIYCLRPFVSVMITHTISGFALKWKM